jgi:hypothetical protein
MISVFIEFSLPNTYGAQVACSKGCFPAALGDLVENEERDGRGILRKLLKCRTYIQSSLITPRHTTGRIKANKSRQILRKDSPVRPIFCMIYLFDHDELLGRRCLPP